MELQYNEDNESFPKGFPTSFVLSQKKNQFKHLAI